MSKRLKIAYSQEARRQLADLYYYIARESGARRADGYVGRIGRYCTSLTTFPHRGTRRDDLLVGLRAIGFERRVTIAFTVSSDTVLILSVLHGGQDIDAAFRTD